MNSSFIHSSPKLEMAHVYQQENGFLKMEYIYKMKYFSDIKNKLLIHTETWINLKIMPNKRRQEQKNRCVLFIYMKSKMRRKYTVIEIRKWLLGS